MDNLALWFGAKCVVIGGAIVPFQVVQELSELMLNYVEVTAVRPVVPEVHFLKTGALVDNYEDRVELGRPWRWSWFGRFR